MQNSHSQSFIFLLFMLSMYCTASMLPAGRYYYEPEGGYVGNPWVKYSLQFIYLYLGWLLHHLDVLDHFLFQFSQHYINRLRVAKRHKLCFTWSRSRRSAKWVTSDFGRTLVFSVVGGTNLFKIRSVNGAPVSRCEQWLRSGSTMFFGLLPRLFDGIVVSVKGIDWCYVICGIRWYVVGGIRLIRAAMYVNLRRALKMIKGSAFFVALHKGLTHCVKLIRVWLS